MAHGCGAILANGRGALCLGKSGAGKSTAFRMLDGRSGARVLNDDRLVIERRGDGFQLWSTPWPGNAGIARSGDAPLGVIALIGRGERYVVRVLSPREALSRVLPTLALPIWNPHLMAARLDFVGSLVEHVPIVEMNYPLDERTPSWIAARLTEA